MNADMEIIACPSYGGDFPLQTEFTNFAKTFCLRNKVTKEILFEIHRERTNNDRNAKYGYGIGHGSYSTVFELYKNKKPTNYVLKMELQEGDEPHYGCAVYSMFQNSDIYPEELPKTRLIQRIPRILYCGVTTYSKKFIPYMIVEKSISLIDWVEKKNGIRTTNHIIQRLNYAIELFTDMQQLHKLKYAYFDMKSSNIGVNIDGDDIKPTYIDYDTISSYAILTTTLGVPMTITMKMPYVNFYKSRVLSMAEAERIDNAGLAEVLYTLFEFYKYYGNTIYEYFVSGNSFFVRHVMDPSKIGYYQQSIRDIILYLIDAKQHSFKTTYYVADALQDLINLRTQVENDMSNAP